MSQNYTRGGGKSISRMLAAAIAAGLNVGDEALRLITGEKHQYIQRRPARRYNSQTPVRNYRPKFNKYRRPHQGAKECARRRKQMAKGFIR